jgi:hypothetical protein
MFPLRDEDAVRAKGKGAPQAQGVNNYAIGLLCVFVPSISYSRYPSLSTIETIEAIV